MLHICPEMFAVIKDHTTFQIELKLRIIYDKGLERFELMEQSADLQDGKIISINELNYIKFCPYCGIKLSL
jgi:hypothetical protein